MIDGIETDERAEKTPVHFNDSTIKKITSRGQTRLQFVERREECAACFFVRLLLCRKPGFVNSVVHVLINKLTKLRVLVLDLFGKKVGVAVAELIETIVK